MKEKKIAGATRFIISKDKVVKVSLIKKTQDGWLCLDDEGTTYTRKSSYIYKNEQLPKTLISRKHQQKDTVYQVNLEENLINEIESKMFREFGIAFRFLTKVFLTADKAREIYETLVRMKEDNPSELEEWMAIGAI